MREKKMKWLNKIVFCVSLLEWGGNAVGTLASLWATVVLLGGFCSLLSPKDFWFSTVMIFVEATRVFIRNDALVSQWLFGSTRAFRWRDFSLRPMSENSRYRNRIALIIGSCIGGLPVFRPEIATSIIKVALLVIITQILSRLQGRVAKYFLAFLGIAAYCGSTYGFYKTIAALRPRVKEVELFGLILAWDVGTFILAGLAFVIRWKCECLGETRGLISIRVITALSLACLPFLQAVLGSYYQYISTSIAIVLLIILKKPRETLSFQIVETIMPILFFWSVMFPLPGISLKVSFYMLFSAIAAVLIGNLQIPVAFLQILLSILRLCSLLGHHHHDYYPLPVGASPNLVPSIVVFFMLELCQGSSYIVATFIGFMSLRCRKLLARDFEFGEEWGAKAVNLYYHQAYQERMEKGLFGSEKERSTPRLDSFAIECLGCSSSDETQIVGLQVLKSLLESRDSMHQKELISKITCTSNKVVSTLIGMLGYTSRVGEDKETIRLLAAEVIGKLADCCPDNCTEVVQDSTFTTTNIIGFISYCTDEKKIIPDKEVGLFASLHFVGTMLALKGGKTGAKFRQELWENPLLLKSLKGILEYYSDRQERLEVVMDIIAKLALDEAARQEIGSTQGIIGELMRAFLRPNMTSNDLSSLARAAGNALANLTIMSTDNCWAILFADKDHSLIKNLIDMLDDENYGGLAANLLHNLFANSRDKLIDIGAKVHLEPALPKVIEIIRTKEGKQLEAALCFASQIGFVIPEYFAKMLESYTDAEAAELVEKLVDTLILNREPRIEYPRIRRVLVEVIISIVHFCPRYRTILREKGAKDALDMVKGTPSKLEKYRVLLHSGEGVVTESVTMRDLVDKAEKLIHLATPNLGT